MNRPTETVLSRARVAFSMHCSFEKPQSSVYCCILVRRLCAQRQEQKMTATKDTWRCSHDHRCCLLYVYRQWRIKPLPSVCAILHTHRIPPASQPCIAIGSPVPCIRRALEADPTHISLEFELDLRVP